MKFLTLLIILSFVSSAFCVGGYFDAIFCEISGGINGAHYTINLDCEAYGLAIGVVGTSVVATNEAGLIIGSATFPLSVTFGHCTFTNNDIVVARPNDGKIIVKVTSIIGNTLLYEGLIILNGV